MNLLILLQEWTGKMGLPIPTSVYANTDAQVIQMRRLLEESLENLADRGLWQELRKEAALVTLAAEDQGTLSSIATDGYDYMLPYTFWDRTNKLPLVGPLDDQDWQALKAWIITGPRYQFSLREDHLYVTPAPTAGLDWRFVYKSLNTITNSAGASPSNRFAADTDLIRLPSRVVKADLTWRWKQLKGAPYAEDFETAEALIVNAIGRSGGIKRDLHMDGDRSDGPRPAIVVPLMNSVP
jgi:hypothetical protein